MASTPDGGAVVVGTRREPDGAEDAFLTKYDASGARLWERIYGTPVDYDEGRVVAVDGSGNIIMGSTRFGDKPAAVVRKYDPNGINSWTKEHVDTTNIPLDLLLTTMPNDGIWLKFRKAGHAHFRTLFASGSWSVFATAFSANTVYPYLNGVASGAGESAYFAGAWGGDLLVAKYEAALPVWSDIRSFGADVAVGLDVGVDAVGNAYALVEHDGLDYSILVFDVDGNFIRSWQVQADMIGWGVVATPTGETYVVGSKAFSSGGGGVLVKYDAGGNELWTRELDTPVSQLGPAYRRTWDVELASNGDILLLGTTTVSFRSATTLARYASDGTLLFDNDDYFPRNAPDWAGAVALGDDGSLFVGATYRDQEDDRATVAKFDPDGTEIWTRDLAGGDGEQDTVEAMASLSEGGFVLAGSTDAKGGTPDDLDAWLVKVDTQGDATWSRVINVGSEQDQAHDVAVGPAGDFFIAGQTSAGTDDGFVMRLDGDGTPLWTELVDGGLGLDDRLTAIAVTGGGDVYVAGESDTGSSVDVLVRKYDDGGVELWSRTFAGVGGDADIANAVDVYDDGIVVAATLSAAGGSDAALLAYDWDGKLLWTYTYDGNGGDDEGNDVINLGGGRLALVGTSTGATSVDGLVVVVDAMGAELWSGEFDGAANGIDRFVAAVADPNGAGISAYGETQVAGDLQQWLVSIAP